jgi:basic amino acid/polyamine antiporter, APA family
VLVAIACGFAALCYAEFAAMVPVSGSAYTYAYATLGELTAWIIGWDLILEYAVGNVAVAISWSAYLQELIRNVGFEFPAWLGIDYRTAGQDAHRLAAAVQNLSWFSAGVVPGGLDVAGLGLAVQKNAMAWITAPQLGGIPLLFNLPAFFIVALVTWILVIGIRETARFTTVLVVLKMAVIVFFLVLGACYVRAENWTPFAPNGFAGISGAAAIIFFAYIGFDAVSTAAEETRNPQRDLPVGILASLGVSTVVYMAVVVVFTGLAKWDTQGTADPLAAVFSRLGLNWGAGIVAAGALLATTSVLVPFQMGQSRIFFCMARDGLLPPWAARVHPRYRTPHVTILISGLFVAVFAGVTNINEMAELTNIGTLFAFVLVAAGILVLRRKDPARPRPFRAPFVPWVPLGAMVTCGYLMVNLPIKTWIRFVLWLVVGLAIYFTYGLRRSALNRQAGATES